MLKPFDLGLLERGPHADLIRGIAQKCYQNTAVQAIWLGGSLAAGKGDKYSDIDFRIAVEPDQLDKWLKPDWETYLPIPCYGGSFLRFGEQALLHHLILADGTIVDFYVQDTSRKNSEPALVIIACRNESFGAMLEHFVSPASSLTREITSASAKQLLVDYWITTHKEAKGLGRKYDYSNFVGLYFERLALLRAWHMELTNKAIDARVSIHMLGALHEGLNNQLSTKQQSLLGLPSSTVEETVIAIEAIRTEMTRVGRHLAKIHEFEYPHELERTVLKHWQENKAELIKR